MIQVCSRCGTRWNVRDRQRVWCPRCNGTLLAPSAPPPPCGVERTSDRTGRAPPAAPERPAAAACGIPLDRGSARCRHRRPTARRRNWGPTPRYAVIPRWGLVERFERRARAAGRAAPWTVDYRAAHHAGRDHRGARPRRARPHGAIRAADHQPQRAVESGGGVVGDLVRRAGQRGRTLPGVRKHGAADELADRPSCGGIQTHWAPRTPTAVGAARRMSGAVCQFGVGAGLTSSNWPAPKTVWPASAGRSWCGGWCGCSARRFRCSPSRPSFTTDAQGIADNTVTTIVAYLIAMAAMTLVVQVLLGFERSPVERPAKRWVIVADESGEAPVESDSGVPVESEGQNPAA